MMDQMLTSRCWKRDNHYRYKLCPNLGEKAASFVARLGTFTKKLTDIGSHGVFYGFH